MVLVTDTACPPEQRSSNRLTQYSLVAYGRPLSPYSLVDNANFISLPKALLQHKLRIETLPGCLANYGPTASWATVGMDEVLQNSHRLFATNSYLNGDITKVTDSNLVFERVRSQLSQQHYFAFSIVTAENIKQGINQRVNPLIFNLYYPFYFLVKRVMPKLAGFRTVCKRLGILPDVSKAEMMGRLVYKGLSIVDIVEEACKTTFVVKHNAGSDPSQTRPVPGQGFILRLQRIGQFAKPMYVYKFRTMHPYAEYVQAYLHDTNGLDQGGKFKNDFRVSTGGRVLRTYWFDEIPMLYNVLRGDLKLVGIRPLSEHYFSLYPTHAQAIRSRYKPGLLPPFYADLPQTFDEIVQSELTYLAAYEAAPLATDLRYLGRILWTILVKKARSK